MVAMADRQVLTRIRRLLNLEDRSMKLTMPEGLGLLGAVVVGTSLALGVCAAQPEPKGESEESIRQALLTAAQAVLALPRERLEYDVTAYTLGNIALAQIKLGDRVAALGTLKRAYESIDGFLAKKSDIEVLESVTEIARIQREAGDLGAARITLDRLVKLIDSLEGQPFNQELIQVTGTKEPIRKQHEMNAFVRAEMLLFIAGERLALRRSRARTGGLPTSGHGGRAAERLIEADAPRHRGDLSAKVGRRRGGSGCDQAGTRACERTL